MKIEKLNDHQIRITLTQADLAQRQIKISELAYGSEKTRNLFSDMMQQARQKFGFEADNTPLMIEAIPLSADCIVLVITKVEDPEELDTRFSKFAPGVQDDSRPEDNMPEINDGTDSILDLFRRIHESNASQGADTNKKEQKDRKEPAPAPVLNRIFAFSGLSNIIRLAHITGEEFKADTTLYRDPSDDRYLLSVMSTGCSQEEFTRFCNTASEYGSVLRSSDGILAYCEEHCDPILKGTALSALRTF